MCFVTINARRIIVWGLSRIRCSGRSAGQRPRTTRWGDGVHIGDQGRAIAGFSNNNFGNHGVFLVLSGRYEGRNMMDWTLRSIV